MYKSQNIIIPVQMLHDCITDTNVIKQNKSS